ncbi:hypothetical protein HPB50_028020 [Hyalomma asiaticum]|nr:hypothetical protein HPB50_028020 [Hyalomma asiaticum]
MVRDQNNIKKAAPTDGDQPAFSGSLYDESEALCAEDHQGKPDANPPTDDFKNVLRPRKGFNVSTYQKDRIPAAYAMQPAWDWQSRLGYCPQEDSLMDVFSGYEILSFFARHRGVDKEKIDKLVDSVASITDLNKHASQLCETYR